MADLNLDDKICVSDIRYPDGIEPEMDTEQIVLSIRAFLICPLPAGSSITFIIQALYVQLRRNCISSHSNLNICLICYKLKGIRRHVSHMKYAGILRRGMAIILDFIFFCVIFFPVTYLVKGVWLMQPQDHLWIIFDPICGVFLVIIFLYFILLEGILGFTLGKLITGIRVYDSDGGKITVKQSLIRNIARMVDGIFFNLVGVIFIYKSPANQRFGDMIAKTIVCRLD